MRKWLQSSILMGLLLALLVPVTATAQDETPQEVTIRDLYEYDGQVTFDNISDPVLNGELVQFTAVVTAYPKNSGLASIDDNDPDNIGRVHFFVTDTAAASMGRESMSIQIVESDVELVEDLQIGDIYTFTGRLTFFGVVAQFDVTETPQFVNVATDQNRWGDLLDPVELSPSDLNSTEGGVTNAVLENYIKWNGAYVKFTGVEAFDVTGGERPVYAVRDNEDIVYAYDTSLRYRNDKPTYRTGYNYIRPESEGGVGEFVPPPAGAQLDIAGFLTANDSNIGQLNVGSNFSMRINPWYDGVVWVLNESTQEYERRDDLHPDDMQITGFPPTFSNLTFPATPAPADEITISVDVQAAEEGVTISEVQLAYAGGGQEDTVAMSNTGGDTYSYTFAANTFSNYDAVSFEVLATDSEGLTGSTSNSFILLESAVDRISVIQRTGDQGDGPSPLAGKGELPMDITATVVSSYDDGVISVQDNTSAWSGVFLEYSSDYEDLARGDEINITSAEVMEASVASNDNTYTYLANVEFTVNSSGNDLSAVVPDIKTQEVLSVDGGAPGEAYEGMLLKFTDAKYIQLGSFGEFEIATAASETEPYPAPGNGLFVNEDTRGGDIGETGFPGDVNLHLKEGVVFDEVYGLMTWTFGAPKLIPRDLNDLVADDFSFPQPQFDPLVPENNNTVIVDSDLTIEWEATEDYDGNDVSYFWQLTSTDDTTFASPLLSLNSDNNGADPMLTLPYENVDTFLEGQGLAVGDTKEYFWTVYATDGVDTVQSASGVADFDTGDFAEQWNNVTLERAEETALEDELGVPKQFDLKQNYPNPFNPSTTISYAVPKSADVKITVFDMLGKKVATLVNKKQTAGRYTVKFDASQLSSGVYFYRLNAGSFNKTQKMLLIK